MAKYENTDQEILELASRLFKKNGILNTEMKDIAKELGCSRSTLYRHFPGKESVLFALSSDVVLRIMETTILPKERGFDSGYEALEWQLRRLTTYLQTHVDEVCFIRDFDFYFTQSFPQMEGAFRFEKSISNTKGGMDVEASIRRGIEDGSIRPVKDISLLRVSLINSCIGLAQRILPREKIYAKEIGYGHEMVDCLLELLLSSVKGEK